ncbi:hypothetical protein DFP72DRAFT_862855 [Ephemerocybe angulata]|uniref:Uncharacterized protein n=1 Tax=Ephemerocybe angulata TaxID=980116 RepID=A0A8H6LU47_9AGAR|nr:hypothetical protein DFP72DRAFT_862855 [Tulosesus angulatus]
MPLPLRQLLAIPEGGEGGPMDGGEVMQRDGGEGELMDGGEGELMDVGEGEPMDGEPMEGQSSEEPEEPMNNSLGRHLLTADGLTGVGVASSSQAHPSGTQVATQSIQHPQFSSVQRVAGLSNSHHKGKRPASSTQLQLPIPSRQLLAVPEEEEQEGEPMEGQLSEVPMNNILDRRLPTVDGLTGPGVLPSSVRDVMKQKEKNARSST